MENTLFRLAGGVALGSAPEEFHNLDWGTAERHVGQLLCDRSILVAQHQDLWVNAVLLIASNRLCMRVLRPSSWISRGGLFRPVWILQKVLVTSNPSKHSALRQRLAREKLLGPWNFRN